MSQWIIHSSNLLLYNKTMTVYEWVVESFNQINDLFYNTDSFSNTTSDCHYEWVSESFIQMICSVMLICSVTKQVTGDMNESLNYPFKWFILKRWFYQ